jgi:hypothetical protein
VTTKSGSLKIEMHDKLAALAQLARIFGLSQDATPPTSVTVNQLNMSSVPDTAFEAARRLAFALAKAQQSAAFVGLDPHMVDKASENGNYPAGKRSARNSDAVSTVYATAPRASYHIATA